MITHQHIIRYYYYILFKTIKIITIGYKLINIDFQLCNIL